MHQRLKTTIVYVTHDQVKAMTMADKIVVLERGRVEQISSPPAIWWFTREAVAGPGQLGTSILTLGIRPEDIALGGENGVDAVVKVVEPETHVAVEIEGKELTWVVRQRVELIPEQHVKLSFETAKVHFFDRQTQQRLEA